MVLSMKVGAAQHERVRALRANQSLLSHIPTGPKHGSFLKDFEICVLMLRNNWKFGKD